MFQTETSLFWVRACDIVTIPWGWNEFSAYYTSPMKLFEYMAAGTPIIASDLPSIREVLQHRETAWLVEPGNPTDLAEGIKHLMNDSCLKNRLSSAACKAVRQHTWRERALRILNEAGLPPQVNHLRCGQLIISRTGSD